MHTRAKIFIADCVIGAAIGAILGVFIGIATHSSIAGWLIAHTSVGLVVCGAIGSVMEVRQKKGRTLGSIDDGALLGLFGGWVTGYIGLTAGALTSGGMTLAKFGQEGYFIAFALASLIIAVLCALIGLFINGAIAGLGKQNKPESSNP